MTRTPGWLVSQDSLFSQGLTRTKTLKQSGPVLSEPHDALDVDALLPALPTHGITGKHGLSVSFFCCFDVGLQLRSRLVSCLDVAEFPVMEPSSSCMSTEGIRRLLENA
jgi:hypothetical protein